MKRILVYLLTAPGLYFLLGTIGCMIVSKFGKVQVALPLFQAGHNGFYLSLLFGSLAASLAAIILAGKVSRKRSTVSLLVLNGAWLLFGLICYTPMIHSYFHPFRVDPSQMFISHQRPG